jgi:hypothetical protein
MSSGGDSPSSLQGIKGRERAVRAIQACASVMTFRLIYMRKTCQIHMGHPVHLRDSLAVPRSAEADENVTAELIFFAKRAFGSETGMRKGLDSSPRALQHPPKHRTPSQHLNIMYNVWFKSPTESAIVSISPSTYLLVLAFRS